MGIILDTIPIYEELRKYQYTVKIETGLEFSFRFRPENYHHLAGFQHLQDMPEINTPPYGSRWFYKQVKQERINEAIITSSDYFPKIQDRLQFFFKIHEILFHSNEIIIDYNKMQAQSDIIADFLLYRRDGDLIRGPYTFYHLFIGHDKSKALYFPTTYIVEHTKQYVSGQKMFNCKVIVS